MAVAAAFLLPRRHTRLQLPQQLQLTLRDSVSFPYAPPPGLQVEKAEKREETVAVAVVQVAPRQQCSGGGDAKTPPQPTHFLLVQRPNTGLLAGLWQFPLVPLAGSSGAAAAGDDSEGEGEQGQQTQTQQPQPQQAMNAYLEGLLGRPLQHKRQGAGADSAVGWVGGRWRLPTGRSLPPHCTLRTPLTGAPAFPLPAAAQANPLTLPAWPWCIARRWARWCTSSRTYV